MEAPEEEIPSHPTGTEKEPQQVRIKLTIVMKRDASIPVWEDKAQMEYVKVQLVTVDTRVKRKRTKYSPDQKTLALLI